MCTKGINSDRWIPQEGKCPLEYAFVPIGQNRLPAKDRRRGWRIGGKQHLKTLLALRGTRDLEHHPILIQSKGKFFVARKGAGDIEKVNSVVAEAWTLIVRDKKYHDAEVQETRHHEEEMRGSPIIRNAPNTTRV